MKRKYNRETTFDIQVHSSKTMKRKEATRASASAEIPKYRQAALDIRMFELPHFAHALPARGHSIHKREGRASEALQTTCEHLTKANSCFTLTKLATETFALAGLRYVGGLSSGLLCEASQG